MTTKEFAVYPNAGVQTLLVYAPDFSQGRTYSAFIVYPLTGIGNQLQTTSYIVDMSIPREPKADDKKPVKRDGNGNRVTWA